MSQVLEKIKKEIEEFEVKKNQLLEELRKQFPLMFQPLMSKLKTIDSIGWTQYTPYFNDGESCVFGVNIDYLTINREYDLYETFDYNKLETEEQLEASNLLSKLLGNPLKNLGDKGYHLKSEYDIEDIITLVEIKEILNNIPKDFYQDLFGDHVRVTINKDGSIDVTEYDHD